MDKTTTWLVRGAAGVVIAGSLLYVIKEIRTYLLRRELRRELIENMYGDQKEYKEKTNIPFPWSDHIYQNILGDKFTVKRTQVVAIETTRKDLLNLLDDAENNLSNLIAKPSSRESAMQTCLKEKKMAKNRCKYLYVDYRVKNRLWELKNEDNPFIDKDEKASKHFVQLNFQYSLQTVNKTKYLTRGNLICPNPKLKSKTISIWQKYSEIRPDSTPLKNLGLSGVITDRFPSNGFERSVCKRFSPF